MAPPLNPNYNEKMGMLAIQDCWPSQEGSGQGDGEGLGGGGTLPSFALMLVFVWDSPLRSN